MSKLETILIVPDSHHPFHDKKAWNLMLKIGRDLKPDHVVHLGDLVDFYALSFHSKDPRRALELQAELNSGKQALKELKALGAKHNVLLGSNHHDRLVRYLQGRAPELSGILSEEGLLELATIGFKLIPYRQSHTIGKLRLTHDVGLAGVGAARKSMLAVGRNLVIGHVHRMELVVGGTTEGEQHVGASFGWLGDIHEIDYMHRDKVKRDWSLGFGIGYHNTATGAVHLVPVSILPDYTAVVNGKLYKA